ncbi:hypothetical protein DD238_005574 [Peronospora effusa]|uniref:Uncharacterized protein n=1 Tax=Peronospora effusa TaxID=542832 RepID=A0A3M6VDL5_9STRA|nr:hypothetical protein DD238_005574 [Peronospora effusa]
MTLSSPPLTLRVEFQQQFGPFEQLHGPMTLRLRHGPVSLIELQDIIQQHLTQYFETPATKLDIKIEIHDQKVQRFTPLKELSQLRRRSRLSVIFTNTSELFQDHTCLALPSRIFGFNAAATNDKIMIDGRVVHIEEVGNAGKGTGLTTWDGSVVLAKYLEYQRRDDIAGKKIVELGAGTGLVGIAAALLGAQEVILSDLDYVIDNLANNVAETMKLAANANRPVDCDVSTRVLNWFNPPINLGDIDFILASDVVWIEELIPPLVATVDLLLRHSAVKTEILMSYQKRSIVSDQVLVSELKRYNFVTTRVPVTNLHPEFSTDRIDVWIIKRDDVE